jgi:hypothetical protein
MDKSESIGQLAKSLSAAQGEMSGAKKDSTNPFFKSTYSDLESIIEAIRGPFVKQGLAFTQSTDFTEDGTVSVTSYIIHSSGEYISGKMGQKPLDNKPQTVGSLISYLKRYTLQALAGVPSVDDDAEAAQGRSQPQRQMGAPLNVNKAPSDGSVHLFNGAKSVYVVPFGKFKGKTLKEIPADDLASFAQYLSKAPDPSPNAVEFLKQYKEMDGKLL